MNHRHRDFQSRALPTELPGRRARPDGGRESAGGYRGSFRAVQTSGRGRKPPDVRTSGPLPLFPCGNSRTGSDGRSDHPLRLAPCSRGILLGARPTPGRRRAAPALRVRRHRRSAGALARAVHRGRQGDHEPALHELPSGERPSDPRQRQHPHLPPVTRGADGGGVPGNTLRRLPHGPQRPIFAGRDASFQSIPGHPRWGVAPIEMAGRASRRRDLPADQGSRSATAGAISRWCRSTSRTTISSAGPGIRARVASPRPAPRRRSANWSRPGSRAARSVRRASLLY